MAPLPHSSLRATEPSLTQPAANTTPLHTPALRVSDPSSDHVALILGVITIFLTIAVPITIALLEWRRRGLRSKRKQFRGACCKSLDSEKELAIGPMQVVRPFSGCRCREAWILEAIHRWRRYRLGKPSSRLDLRTIAALRTVASRTLGE